MRILMTAAMAGTLVLAGCTTNPYTGERQVSKGAYGAIIGAAAGCAIASATTKRGERNERCGQGAAIGGAYGAATGFGEGEGGAVGGRGVVRLELRGAEKGGAAVLPPRPRPLPSAPVSAR